MPISREQQQKQQSKGALRSAGAPFGCSKSRTRVLEIRLARWVQLAAVAALLLLVGIFVMLARLEHMARMSEMRHAEDAGRESGE